MKLTIEFLDGTVIPERWVESVDTYGDGKTLNVLPTRHGGEYEHYPLSVIKVWKTEQ